MNPLQIIDDVLTDINTVNGTSGKYVSFAQIYSTSSRSYIANLPELDKLIILNKLLRDNMITSRPAIQSIDILPDNTPMYLITFEGALFIKQGGYKGQHNIKRLSKVLQIAQIILIVVAALLAAVFAGLDYQDHHHNFLLEKNQHNTNSQSVEPKR